MYLSKSCSQPIKSHDKRANSLIDTSLKGYNLGEKKKNQSIGLVFKMHFKHKP